ncbi:hypothetical protein F2Q69_00026731 [Brassica cretica]|uniref:Uncharacterized protein n=1 Tax=Brassica cretica TaxID=69181 RepID=A0A8S9RZ04_BRACR|nr:hypothetical protein F2Q69_00026731 [Brassica cretica]
MCVKTLNNSITASETNGFYIWNVELVHVFVQDNRTGEKVAILIGKWDEAMYYVLGDPTTKPKGYDPMTEAARRLQEKGWKPRWFGKDEGDYRYLGGYWKQERRKIGTKITDIFKKQQQRNTVFSLFIIILCFHSHSDLLEVFSTERFNELFEDDGIFNADHESWKEQRRIIITEI